MAINYLGLIGEAAKRFLKNGITGSLPKLPSTINSFNQSGLTKQNFVEPVRPTIDGNAVQGPMNFSVPQKQMQAPKVAPQIVTNPIKNTDQNQEQVLLDSKYGKIKLDANGMPMMDQTIDADVKAMEERAKANAEKEAAARLAAAKKIYESTVSTLDSEQSRIDPIYQDTQEVINKNAFNTTEASKELMNMYGWDPGSSGLAVGELNKISTKKDQDLTKAERDKSQALADIARRKSLASNILSASETEANTLKDTLVRQAAADALLKGKEMFRNYYNDLRNYYKDNADIKIKNEDRAYLKQERDKKTFEDSIKGLGTGYDYSQAIKDLQGDKDTTNDWKIPILEKEKQNKLTGMVSDFEKNVGQFYNDYQDAINKLNPNDPIYKQKLDILKRKQAEKIVNVEAAKKVQEQQAFNNSIEKGKLDEQRASRIANDELQGRQIDISAGNLAVNKGNLALNQNKINKEDQSIASSAYADFVGSGKTFDQWISTPDKNGRTYGDILKPYELQSLIDLLVKAGKLGAKSNSSNALLNNLDILLQGEGK